MSWLDDIVDVGSGVMDWFGENPIAGNILKTVTTGYALSKVAQSMNKENEAAPTGRDTASVRPEQPDTGVRIQLPADTNTKIPVVYGSAFIGGKLIDARMTSDNQTMWYAYVLSERTGKTVLGTGADSYFKFNDIYWNDQRMVFKSDGITANYTVDRNGKIDRSISGLVEVYCYNNGSNNPTPIENYTSGATSPAYDLMPDWDNSWSLDELILVIVKVTYSKEKNVNGIAQMQYHITNSMTKPGDVLYDYMTNTRYGAGIDPQEIKAT
jgi:hypothetical protein